MDLSFSEEQIALKNSVQSLLKAKFSTAILREVEADPFAVRPIYQALSEMGISAINLDEADGGLALGRTDMAVAFQEIGTALIPLQFTETSIFAAEILKSANCEISRNLRAKIANGGVKISCAWQMLSANTAPIARVSATEGTISGTVSFVPEISLADYIIVAANDANGAPALVLMRPTAAGIVATPQDNLADLQLSQLQFHTAPIEALLVTGDEADTALKQALAATKIAIAAQAVGGSQSVLEMTRQYALTRHQFGRPIGSFQVIAHMIADAAVNLEGARYLTFRAAAAADDGEHWTHWADMAKLKACQTFRDISAMAIQVHGGIGFTLEADPQLFYRRAKYLQLMYGSPLDLQEQCGAALVSGEHKVLAA